MSESPFALGATASARLRPVAACLAAAYLAFGWLTPACAQLAPRLTAKVALHELTVAGAALDSAARAKSSSSLTSVQQQLAGMADGVRKSMGSDAVKPVELVGDSLRGRVVRAHAAAARVQAYIEASGKCHGSDAAAMQSALAEGIARLASADDSAKLVPVIDSVETMDHQPLFALHRGGGPLTFALVGANLADAQCADPRVSATDVTGGPLPTQPELTGAVPGRIELRWPDAGTLPEGSVVIHVAAQHKAFLVGCTALPEASAVIRVTSLARFEVAYSLEAVCPGSGGSGVVVLGQGKLPALVGYGATVSLPVDTSACTEPQSYRLSATVTQGDGSKINAGPFTQSAQASITAGLPGGLSLSWKPTVKTLFASSGAPVCNGVQ
jgi:hypothetical protein